MIAVLFICAQCKENSVHPIWMAWWGYVVHQEANEEFNLTVTWIVCLMYVLTWNLSW